MVTGRFSLKHRLRSLDVISRISSCRGGGGGGGGQSAEPAGEVRMEQKKEATEKAMALASFQGKRRRIWKSTTGGSSDTQVSVNPSK